MGGNYCVVFFGFCDGDFEFVWQELVFCMIGGLLLDKFVIGVWIGDFIGCSVGIGVGCDVVDGVV